MSHSASLLINYLLNSIWQTPLLFGAATLGALLLRRQNPLSIHRLWAATLVLQILLPAFSVAAPMRFVLSWLTMNRGLVPYSSVTVTFGPPTAWNRIPLSFGVEHAILAVYVLTALYASLKLASGVARTVRLGRRTQLTRLAPSAGAVWSRCRRDFACPGALLCESVDVQTPMTMGLRRPLIVLPNGLANALAEDDLGTLLAHECAHIQRKDYGWNLLYEVLAIPVAYHPVARLTRASVAESREWVCDAMAVHAIARPLPYAQSLLRLATRLAGPKPGIAPHAIGMLDANALERRLMHLLDKNPKTTGLRRYAAFAGCALLGLSTCVTAWALRTGVNTSTPPAAHAQGPSTKVPGGVMAGNVESRVNPVYPPEAKQAGIQGSVVLHAVISKDGTIENLSVLSGPEELVTSAIDAVKQWTYKPYELDGEPVEVETTITVNYHLNQ